MKNLLKKQPHQRIQWITKKQQIDKIIKKTKDNICVLNVIFYFYLLEIIQEE